MPATNIGATYIYRREIAKAISRYNSSLRTIFAAHESPIPPTPECAGAMGNAWGTCRVDFYKADVALDAARHEIAHEAAVREWERNCLAYRGF